MSESLEYLTQEIPTKETFKALGLEISEIVNGKIDRPVAPSEAKFPSSKMYIAIPLERQTELRIEKPSNCIVATIKDGKVFFYILSALIDDETFRKNAGNGVYRSLGIEDVQAAKAIIENNPISKDSLGASITGNDIGETLSFGIIDLEKMQGKALLTNLSVQNLETYPDHLQNPDNPKNLPVVIVPSPIAKAIGLKMEKTTLAPKEMGGTVAKNEEGILEVDGVETEVLFVGALDKLGISAEFSSKLKLEKVQEIQAVVGAKRIRINSSKATDDILGQTNAAAAKVL